MKSLVKNSLKTKLKKKMILIRVLISSYPGYNHLRWSFNVAYVLFRWGYLTLNYKEAKWKRRYMKGEYDLKKLWGAENDFRNPLMLPFLRIAEIRPNILLDLNHFNPTIKIQDSMIHIYWRASNYQMPIEFNKFGIPKTTIIRIRNTEHIVAGSFNYDPNLRKITPNKQFIVESKLLEIQSKLEKDFLENGGKIFLEDPRVHSGQGNYLTAVARFGTEPSNNIEHYFTRMALVDLKKNETRIIEGKNFLQFEKNWVVASADQNNIVFLRSTYPKVLVNVDVNTGQSTELANSGSTENIKQNLNGGSPFVLIDEKFYLRVARMQLQIRNIGTARINCLVMHDLDFREVSRSVPFIFLNIGVEICNGFAYSDEKFFFSWGENDRKMFFGSCQREELLEWYFSHNLNSAK